MRSVLVIGVDCSTTACKAIAWDTHDGAAVAEGRATFPLSNPRPGAWEQDANHWWRALGESCRALVSALGERVKDVASLALTHQRETVVVTDPRGEPLAPALVWMDSRATPQVERAVQQLGARHIHELSGKPPCTTPSLYKLRYLFDHYPRLQHAQISDVHGFLARKLLGRHVSSLASVDPMGLLDLSQGTYAPDLLDFLGVGEHQLPQLVSAGARVGGLSSSAAAHTGLPAGLMVVSGAGDGQAAGLGAGVCAPGEAYLNLGTALVSGVLSHEYLTDLSYRTLFAATPACDLSFGAMPEEGLPSYFLETDLKGGSFSFDWLIDRLLSDNAGLGGAYQPARDGKTGQGSEAAPDSELPTGPPTKRQRLEGLAQLAHKLPPGSEGLMLLPYFNGVMNPYWDDLASGALVGLRGHHGPEHVYRAIAEGLAFEQRLHTSSVEASAGEISQLVCMGGSSDARWVRQLFADVMNKPLVRATSTEATCLGAGILAACGAGAFRHSAEAVAAMTSRGERVEPAAQRAAYDQLFREVYTKLYPSLREPLARLSALTQPATAPDGAAAAADGAATGSAATGSAATKRSAE